MGYEGHLMKIADRDEQRAKVAAAMDKLMVAAAAVGGDIVSAGGTDTWDLHDRVNEIQAGTYALMDTHYGGRGHPFRQACFVLATVIAANDEWAVADAGLKTQGMDHGNPAIEGATVRFLSDEHVTFVAPQRPRLGEKIKLIPAHIDPTMAMHELAYLVRDDEVIDRWPIDLRNW
jgi:D-serine deaminase-like pyridoxal phosphate-dependent protein